MLEWRPATGRRTSNALIPNVGKGKAVNAEARATFSDDEEPACEGKQDTHRETEREREAQRVYLYSRECNNYK